VVTTLVGAFERAWQLHFSSLVLDTHIDTPWIMVTRPDWSFAQEHNQGHADLPRIKKGGLRAMFMGVAAMEGKTAGPAAVNEALIQSQLFTSLQRTCPAKSLFAALPLKSGRHTGSAN